MKLFNILFRPLVSLKARKISFHCGPFIRGNVLDVGAGRCLIARQIQNQYDVSVKCIDIDDLNETDMKLMLYDGKNIPFRSNSFDTVLIVYVLHHCTDPVSVLKESRRVCKKGGKIIIFEDIGRKFPTYFLDWIGNKLHNVDAPLNFKKEAEWLKIFRSLKLRPVHVESGVEKQVFYPGVNHTMFVLEVDK